MVTNVQRILDKHWHSARVPVNPVSIAVSMGVAVTADPSRTTGGCYIAKGPRIIYSSADNTVRQRFAVAHALGHHVLGHGDSDTSTPAQYTLETDDDAELQANLFALRLLMPEDCVRAAISVKHINSVKDIASMFGVAIGAAKARLKEIGYDV